MGNKLFKKGAVVLATVLALSFLFSSCKKQEGDQLAAIKKAGKIQIALEGAWAPWSFHEAGTEALIGFDTEVGRGIAKRLGVEPVFSEVDWDGLFAGLEGGRYDLVINGVEWTEDRARKYDFTEPYAFIKTALIVRDDNEDIKTFEDLKGKNTCNSINSTYMLLAEQYGATVQGVDSLEETLNMVIAGRVDATLNAELSYDDYMNVHADAPLKVVALTEESSKVLIPTRKGEASENLRAAINDALKDMKESGELSELSLKYFGKDITKE